MTEKRTFKGKYFDVAFSKSGKELTIEFTIGKDCNVKKEITLAVLAVFSMALIPNVNNEGSCSMVLNIESDLDDPEPWVVGKIVEVETCLRASLIGSAQ